jgi:signal transduction histidine kinase/HAMP domain-containing protein
MRPPRLAVVLVVVIAGVSALAIGAVSVSATRILRRIAEDEALATARVAATAVVERIQREQEDLATAARLLAERPTLRRLIGAHDVIGLVAFLDRFRATTGLTSALVTEGQVSLALSGAPLSPEAAAAATGRVRNFLVLEDRGAHARLTSFAEVAGMPGLVVAVSRDIPTTGSALPPSSANPRLAVLDGEAVGRDIASPRSALRNEVLLSGEGRAARVRDALVAATALRSAGRIVGVVEAEVAVSDADVAGRRWIRDVRRIALFVLAIAIAVGAVLGRDLARPLDALARAARRIGAGDLETPVPRAPGRETGTLSEVMEESRIRLLDASRQLRQRQAESEAVLGGISEGVFGVDDDRRVRYVNSRAAMLLNLTPEAILGRFCGDVLRPEDEDGERPCENRCPILRARAGTASRAIERIRPEGGTPRTVVITSSFPVEGRQVQLVRDETEVEATRRLRDTVVANISHEFKTPLAAQLASIEMLRDRLDALTPGEARELVLSMERGAMRLARLVDNLLESVRLEAGEKGIRELPVALDEVVEEAAESMRPLLEQKGQSLEIDLPHPLPPIRGDAPRLVQVLVNLLANANKFGPPGSRIRVGGTIEPPGVTLFVADSGPGLPDGDDVFGRFVRRAGDEPEQSGLGLGLWISKSIVDRHGGRIWSAPVPSGTMMCIALPEAPREDSRRG